MEIVKTDVGVETKFVLTLSDEDVEKLTYGLNCIFMPGIDFPEELFVLLEKLTGTRRLA